MSEQYCCEAFAKQAAEYQRPAGGGFYLPEMRPVSQFERQNDGVWAINGCCGGGCFVVTDMKFCPYCGTELT